MGERPTKRATKRAPAKAGTRRKPDPQSAARRAMARLKKGVVESLSDFGNVTRACSAAGVPRRTYYNWLAADAEFAQAAADAIDEAADMLEEEARRRAVEGVTRLRHAGGKLVMVQDPNSPEGAMIPLIEREYSDTLLIFLLKGLRPWKYADRRQHSGPAGGPIRHQQVKDNTDDLMDEMVQLREARVARARKGDDN